MSSATSKPQAILTLEKILGFELDDLTGKEPEWPSNPCFQCNDEGEVITLNLRGTDLDAIPKLIGFEHLQYLDLGDNRISKIENLDSLTNLRILYLSENQISKIENLDTLNNLTSLYLSRTRISKIENLETLNNLTSLSLAGTQISKIENLDALSNLTKLNLSSTRISKIENLATLTNLTSLFLAGIQISKIENLDSLTNLTSLFLSSTRISKIENLATLTNLTSLDLRGTQISKIENLATLTNLTSLDLRGTQISKIENLATLTNLTSLDLSRIQISKIENLATLTNLTRLDLSRTQISKIENLATLTNLTSLDLSWTQISKIENLATLTNLTSLDLSETDISKIENLATLTNLTRLFLSSTQISKIENLEPLNNLTSLDLSSTRISKIENLATLTNLTSLDLSWTQISKIENLATLTNLTRLDLSETDISKIENLETLNNLTSLDLSWTQISKIENLATLTNLTRLSLSNTQIRKIENLNALTNLTRIYLTGVDIRKIENLATLTNLTSLDLSWTRISKIENLETLSNLTSLNLSSTRISKIENLNALSNLTRLFLSSTQISKIENLETLSNLTSLDLSGTDISKIENIEKLTALRSLNLSYVQIKSIDDLDVLPSQLENLDLRGNNGEIDVTNLNNFHSLECLYVAKNTIVRQVENGGKLKCRLILSPYENNLDDIRRWMAREIKEYITPQVKVMLLGNHASGKSTFLDKLCETPVPTDKPIPSTHVLRVVKKSGLNANFYDFGGQDYYHGVYQAFNSSGALYLLFWQSGTDKNSNGRDSRQEGILNFDRNYWLGQINYAIRQKRIEILDDESKGNVLVVQTHADRDPQRNLKVDNRLVGEEFYLALERKGDINETKKAQDQVAYTYLQLRIQEEITKLRDGNKIDVTAGERILYDFLSTNSRQDCSGYITIEELQTELKMQGYEDSLACLMGDLHQLYLQGEVLYYKDDKMLRDVVWLDPEATVNHIHTEILKEKYIGQGGKVKVEDLTTATNKYLVRLLQLEKVIYQDGEEFIIPGYLPLADGDEMYEWLKLGYIHPDVTLKFEHFIPFGLINQLICYYGRGENELKKYWRDQLFFTLAYRPVHEEEEKESPTFPFMVWISLNHEHLTIEVYIKAIDERHDKYLATVRREIMEDILDMYWNNLSSIDDDETWRSRKSRHEYLRIHSPIDDLYISTYDTCGQSGRKLFAKLSEIDHYDPEKEENGTHISRGYIAAYPLTKEGTLEKGKPQGISLRSFRQLTGNKHIGRMKKIFISYSKQDEEDLGVCLQFLKPLEDKGYIQVYYDKLTGAGEFIHPIIRKEILDSDCMISLVSPGYLSTDYITKLELPLADKEGKTIFPFVIKPCVWEENPIIQGRYVSLKGETSGSEKVLFHGQSERYVSQAINHQVWKKFVEEFKKKVLKL